MRLSLSSSFSLHLCTIFLASKQAGYVYKVFFQETSISRRAGTGDGRTDGQPASEEAEVRASYLFVSTFMRCRTRSRGRRRSAGSLLVYSSLLPPSSLLPSLPTKHECAQFPGNFKFRVGSLAHLCPADPHTQRHTREIAHFGAVRDSERESRLSFGLSVTRTVNNCTLHMGY